MDRFTQPVLFYRISLKTEMPKARRPQRGLLQKLGAEESRGRRERGTGDAMKRQVQDCKGRSNRKGLAGGAAVL